MNYYSTGCQAPAKTLGTEDLTTTGTTIFLFLKDTLSHILLAHRELSWLCGLGPILKSCFYELFLWTVFMNCFYELFLLDRMIMLNKGLVRLRQNRNNPGIIIRISIVTCRQSGKSESWRPKKKQERATLFRSKQDLTLIRHWRW